MNSHGSHSSRSHDDGERPFWISYADLMTALMILFLVVMVTALTHITNKQSESAAVVPTREGPTMVTSSERDKDIGNICSELSTQTTLVNPNISVDCSLNRISFGEIGQFPKGEYVLGAQGQQALQDLLPIILQTASSPTGQRWLKQIVIEGFTDTDGSYLYNLNLSLRRSEWVMCAILGHAGTPAVELDTAQSKQIKQLFLAGGVSFNNERSSKDASRRIELRLQFYGLDEAPRPSIFNDQKFEDSSKERCHI